MTVNIPNKHTELEKHITKGPMDSSFAEVVQRLCHVGDDYDSGEGGETIA